jgi:hypothetical protein
VYKNQWLLKWSRAESWRGRCYEHGDLYWFRLLERNTHMSSVRMYFLYSSFWASVWREKIQVRSIADWKVPANCPSVFYTCQVLTYTVGSPLCWVARVLALDSGIITTLWLVPSDSLEGSALGENSSSLLIVHDVPSVGPSAPLVKGYVLGHHPTSHLSRFRCYSWCCNMLPSHCILLAHI